MLNRIRHSCFKIFLLFASLSVAGASLQTLHSAQSTEVPDDSIEVTIKSASGKERYPLQHDGMIDRVGLRPGQTVQIKLKFKGKKTGEAVHVSSLDGGELSGHGSLAISSNGNLQFNYQAGAEPGRYRVILSLAQEEYWFEFYVLNTSNPGSNPPRVRVVE